MFLSVVDNRHHTAAGGSAVPQQQDVCPRLELATGVSRIGVILGCKGLARVRITAHEMDSRYELHVEKPDPRSDGRSKPNA